MIGVVDAIVTWWRRRRSPFPDKITAPDLPSGGNDVPIDPLEIGDDGRLDDSDDD